MLVFIRNTEYRLSELRKLRLETCSDGAANSVSGPCWPRRILIRLGVGPMSRPINIGPTRYLNWALVREDEALRTTRRSLATYYQRWQEVTTKFQVPSPRSGKLKIINYSKNVLGRTHTRKIVLLVRKPSINTCASGLVLPLQTTFVVYLCWHCKR